MHTILYYDYVADYLTRRGAYRDAHLAHAKAAFDRGELVLGGAMAGDPPAATIIFRGGSPETAEAFAKSDPYVANGIVTAWRTRVWNTVNLDGAPAR